MSGTSDGDGMERTTRSTIGSFDPRRSVTGQLIAVGVCWSLATAAAVAVGGWWVTTSLEPTPEAAAVGRRVAAVTVAALLGVGWLGLAGIHRSVVVGLRRLDDRTSAIVDEGRYGTEIDVERRDEIGQLGWRIGELRSDLLAQVEAVESLNRDLGRIAGRQSRALTASRGGDLTVRMTEETGIPQFDALATNFNAMMDRTETLVAEVDAFGRAVSDAAGEAATAVDGVEAGSRTVADAAAEIEGRITRQHRRLDETTDATADLVDSVDEIATEAETVAERSRRAVDHAEAGVAAATDTRDQFERIRTRTDATAAVVADLEALTDEIGSATDRIDEMAARSQRLAVNARIEAGRTGDDGRSAVREFIGSQVGELAADTAAAAEEIDEVTDRVLARIDRVAEAADETQRAVDNGVETVDETADALSRIEREVAATADGVAEIASATDRGSDRTATVATELVEIRRLGGATVEEADEVATVSREQRAATDAVGTRLRRLTTVAGQLEDGLSTFTVSPSARKSAPTPTEFG